MTSVAGSRLKTEDINCVRCVVVGPGGWSVWCGVSGQPSHWWWQVAVRGTALRPYRPNPALWAPARYSGPAPALTFLRETCAQSGRAARPSESYSGICCLACVKCDGQNVTRCLEAALEL